MPVKDVIFDLDGTLIDSAQGILSSFAGAFDVCRMKPVRELTAAEVGPPLLETLAGLAGTDEPTTLQQLAEAFKAIYDESGYRRTIVFPGVVAMLSGLSTMHCRLYIATNKRRLPTARIMELLGWESHFAAIYSLDTFTPPLASKAALLGQVLSDQGIDVRSALYIGDRREDGEAAAANAIGFLMAGWGYAGSPQPAWDVLQSPSDLDEAIRRRTGA